MTPFSGIALYNNPRFRYLLQPRYRVLRHSVYVGFILLFWGLYGSRYVKDVFSLLQLIAYGLSYVVIIYFNFLVLMPRLLYRNKVSIYLALTYASFVLGYAIQHAIYSKDWAEFMTLFVFDRERIVDMLINAITFIMFCGVGWAFSMFKMWLTGEGKIEQLKNENLKAELNNLKNQVNPHFLFNAFNNIYVTSKTNPAAVPPMILDMADLMRYQLQECSYEKVPLAKEIAYIKNFIGIERVRKDHADIRLDISGNADNIFVEPLLFIALVENAFKHGLGKMEKGYVFISLKIQNREQLHLIVENNKPATTTKDEKNSTGIGLTNLKRRLELAYPQKHALEIVETPDKFIAKLELYFK